MRGAIALLSVLAVACAFPGLAQGLHFGLKAGVPLTPYFDTGRASSISPTPYYREEYSAATRRYTVGASFEWRMTPRFGFEVDGLYHRMGYVHLLDTCCELPVISHHLALDTKGNSWDFPVMAKFRIARRFHPFLDGGGVLRYVASIRGRGEESLQLLNEPPTTAALDTSDPSELRKRLYPGLTFGAGLEFGSRRIRLLPEFRYTRWLQNVSAPPDLLRFAPDQAEVFVGLLF